MGLLSGNGFEEGRVGTENAGCIGRSAPFQPSAAAPLLVAGGARPVGEFEILPAVGGRPRYVDVMRRQHVGHVHAVSRDDSYGREEICSRQAGAIQGGINVTVAGFSERAGQNRMTAPTGECLDPVQDASASPIVSRDGLS
jgi:hypothetical protein